MDSPLSYRTRKLVRHATVRVHMKTNCQTSAISLSSHIYRYFHSQTLTIQQDLYSNANTQLVGAESGVGSRSGEENSRSRFFTMYNTVAKKNTIARNMRSLSVHSRRLYFVRSLRAVWMWPVMLRNSSRVSPTCLDDETENTVGKYMSLPYRSQSTGMMMIL